MEPILIPARERGALRRGWRGRCQAISLRDFRLIGRRLLDVSPDGLLIAADGPVGPGERVLVSFQAPGGANWFEAEARVARVIEGWRDGDPGYCMALRFTRIAPSQRVDLDRRLRGLPPPLPLRPLRWDYAETVRQIHAS